MKSKIIAGALLGTVLAVPAIADAHPGPTYHGGYVQPPAIVTYRAPYAVQHHWHGQPFGYCVHGKPWKKYSKHWRRYHAWDDHRQREHDRHRGGGHGGRYDH